MRKAKVLVVSLQRRGGGALDSLGLSNGLCANAFPHDIVIAAGNERASEFTENAYRRTEKIPTYNSTRSFLFHSLCLVRPLRLIRIVLAVRPTIVHVTHFHPWVAVLFAGRPFFGYRIIYGVHEDPYRTKDATNPAAIAPLERIFIKRADLVMTYSDFMRNELSSRLPEEKLRTIPLGAYDYFCASFVRQVHPSDEPLRLLFFGPIKEYKGVDVLVRAMTICAAQGVRASLTIAGFQSPALRILDEEKVRALGITWLNRYVPDEELCRLLGETEVMVVPYRDATQTTPGALAIGYGIPMIASQSGGLREQVEDGVSGILVPPDDPEALAEAIKKVAADRNLLEHFRKGTLALYRKKFSWAVIAEGLIRDVYLPLAE